MLNIRPFIIGFLLFFSLFSGNGEVLGVKLLYPTFVIFLTYLSLTYERVRLDFRSLVRLYVSIIIFITILLYPTIKISHWLEDYSFWLLQFCIVFPIFVVLMKEINGFSEREWQKFFLFFLLLFAFFASAIVLSNSSTGRVHFIFGPNVLYRVLCFLMIVSLGVSFYKDSRVLCAVIVLISMFALLKIGSRGGMILLIFSFVCIFHHNVFKIKLKHIIVFSFLFLLCLSVLFSFIDYLPINQRLLLFDIENNTSSIGIRFYTLMWYLNNFIEVTFNIEGMYEYFFESFSIPGFLYPHNLILEFVIFYGLFGFILASIYIIALVSTLKRFLFTTFSFSHVLFYSLLTLTPSVFFSGNLSDNIAIFSFLLSFPFLKINTKNNRI